MTRVLRCHDFRSGREAIRRRTSTPQHIQLQRTRKLHHRLLASASITLHTLFRPETRWPGYGYRGDRMKLDGRNRHCFGPSRDDAKTGHWAMDKAPVYHIID